MMNSLSRKAPLNILRVLALGIWSTLLPMGESLAARCSGVAINFNVPDEINIVGKKVGDVILDFKNITSVSGSCTKENTSITGGQYIYLADRIKQPAPSGGWCGSDSGFSEVSSDGVVSIFNSWTCSQSLIYYGYLPNLSQGAGGALTSYNHSQLRLNKKVPGRITFNPFFFMRNDFVSQIGGYPNTLQSESVAVSGIKNITLVYTPTCSASVDDVTFPGTPAARAIAAGTVTPRTAAVRVTCDDILPKYTIKVSSPKGTHGNPADGVIRSDNATVGYRLTWDKDQVAAANSNVQLNSVLTPVNTPSTSTFTLPINVRPVGLVSLDNIEAGPASSAIQIDLTFN
ncbi:hypothetical protein U8296_004465 [Salmonella enterica]|nr:hypothetical protein [Salmonella enterica]EMB3200868.1 hypothetical protein [Salmonella enterica]